MSTFLMIAICVIGCALVAGIALLIRRGLDERFSRFLNDCFVPSRSAPSFSAGAFVPETSSKQAPSSDVVVHERSPSHRVDTRA